MKISKLNSLLEARRVLRKLKVNSTRNKNDLAQLEKLASQKGLKSTKHSERITASLKEKSNKILHESHNNRKLCTHVKVLLSTHLKSKESLSSKLIRNADIIASDNTEIINKSLNFITAISSITHKDILTITKQISKKFPESKFQTTASLCNSNSVGIVGIISLQNPEQQQFSCVIAKDNESYKLKTFMGDLVVQNIMPTNFIPFSSANKAYNLITDIMKKDSFI